MKLFSIVAVAMLALLAAVPAASAGQSLCDPSKPDAVNRAKCAAVDTANNVLRVAEPVVGFAVTEAAYYGGVACQIIDHNIGGQTCTSALASLVATNAML